VVSCADETSQRHLAVQPLDAAIGVGFGRRVKCGEKDACQEEDDEKGEGDAAETVKVVDPSRYRLVQDTAVSAGEAKAVVEVIEKSHKDLTGSKVNLESLLPQRTQRTAKSKAI
jgi:hypothetical protein